MNQFSFVGKFLLVSIMFMLPLTILGTALFSEIQHNIDTTRTEREGIVLLQKSFNLLFSATDYRDYGIIQRAQSTEYVLKTIQLKQDKVEGDLIAFKHALENVNDSNLHEHILRLEENWKNLKQSSAGAAGGPNIQYQFYDSLVNNIELLVNVVTYDRKLIHDPSLKTFLLINILVKDIPMAIRSLGKARAFGTYALGATGIDYETIKRLDQVYDELLSSSLMIEQSMEYAAKIQDQSSSIQQLSTYLSTGFKVAADYFYLNLIEMDFINQEWEDFYHTMSQSFTSIHEVVDSILPAVDKQLEKRIETEKLKLYTLLLGTLFLLIIVFYLYAAVYFSLTDSIKVFSFKAQQVADGDLTVSLTIESGDELSHLYIAFNNMVSQLKDNQKQLLEAEKMVSLGGMITGVAHELNTPLGILTTAVSYLVEENERLTLKFKGGEITKSDLEHSLKNNLESLQLIHINTERCSSLIRTFKQLNVYQNTKRAAQSNIYDLIKDIPKMLDLENTYPNISLTLECDQQLYFNTIPELLTLVIVNLTLNTLHHAFPDKAGNIKLSITKQDEKLNITFNDNGQGISVDIIDKIFEPFFTTNRNQGNIGLGLHIVYVTITQALNGKISLNEQHVLGTEFTILLNEITGHNPDG